jgi:hypothetical protein
MGSAERPHLPSVSPTKAELQAALENVDRALERANENENPIERYFKRDELLEEQDWLQAELSQVVTDGVDR